MQPHPDRVMEQSRVRVWPGVALAVLLVMLRLVMPAVAPDAAILGLPVPMIGILGGAICAVAIVIWWLFFSRVRWTDRLLILAVSAAAFGAVWLVVDRSVSNGMMGMMYVVFALPLAAIGLVGRGGGGTKCHRGARPDHRPGCRPDRLQPDGGGPHRRHQRRRDLGPPLALDPHARAATPRRSAGSARTARDIGCQVHRTACAGRISGTCHTCRTRTCCTRTSRTSTHPPHPHLLHPWHLPHLSHPLLGGLASGARIATAS